MDLLIKGLEIPKDEYVDVRIFKDGRVIANQADANEPNSHYATFTAIAVPPHGRLIDADNLIDDFKKYMCGKCYVINRAGVACEDCFYRDIEKAIAIAPTVLEANT